MAANLAIGWSGSQRPKVSMAVLPIFFLVLVADYGMGG